MASRRYNDRPTRCRNGGPVAIEVTPELRQRVRSAFPALAGDVAFLENAGGSQVPAAVADRIRDYMVSSYVQLGAG